MLPIAVFQSIPQKTYRISREFKEENHERQYGKKKRNHNFWLALVRPLSPLPSLKTNRRIRKTKRAKVLKLSKKYHGAKKTQ